MSMLQTRPLTARPLDDAREPLAATALAVQRVTDAHRLRGLYP